MDRDFSYKVIGCALKVHQILGPGLLESIYEKALMMELANEGIRARAQVPVEVVYKGVNIGEGLRMDILVEDELVLELKSVEELRPVHFKQLQTYLKLADKRVGLLINFNVDELKEGIHRVVNRY